MLSSGGLDTFIEPGLGSDTPDLLAKNLEPGEYRVECVSDEADPGSFFVSRTVSVGDLLGFVGPVFALLAASAACGLVFLIGTVLLIVGLVKRRRSNRPPGGPGYPQPVSGYQQPMPGYGQPMGGYQPPTGYGPPGARPPDQVTRPPDQSDWQPPPGSH
jgi:hypothetical protein